MFKNKKLIFGLILLLAVGLRLYGINWDQGHHLHPDERFLTMVTTDIKWPESLGQYFQTQDSPLNPRNRGYDFFVYGTFPVFLTKAVAEIFKWGDYMHLTLVGRFLAALADVGVILILYKLTKRIWASLFYTLMILPIQLSHFYAVDPWLNLFLVLSFYAALNWPVWTAGIFLGLALSSKITALLFFPIISLVLLRRFKKINLRFILNAGNLLVTSILTFRIFSPYSFVGIFSINPKFIANLKQLQSFSDPKTLFPPAVQWVKTKPIIFPAKNIFFWGLGIPLSIFVLVAFLHYNFVALKRLFKREENLGKRIMELLDIKIISLIWIISLFLFQGVQFVKSLRYFLMIYPFLAIIAGAFWTKIDLAKWVRGAIIGSLFFWPLAFMNIYTQTHPRIKASKWIYENIPKGSTISCEHWDDCLPLSIGKKNHTLYERETLELFGQDNENKWQKINQQLEKINYIIISSSRLYASIATLPKRYPKTTEFYQKLFAGQLSPPSGQGTFKKVVEITSYPRLFGIELNDDPSEEAFTVYDHPKVIIYKKMNKQ